MRVEIPAYTDRWVMGDRYGQVLATTEARPEIGRLCATCRVKLDKSGDVRTYIADECRVLD